MKVAIIQFPGSNSEAESLRAVRQAGLEAEEFLWNQSYNKLADFDGYFIIGGFSYEDRSRAGIIASLDPLMDKIKLEAAKGKPILGVCNGAQILVESGLVPGLIDNEVGLALAENKRIKNGEVLGTGFYNTWVNVQCAVPSDSCAFTKNLKPDDFIDIPLAHAEGRFVIPQQLLEEMKANHLTTFRYCDDEGQIVEDFPTNPNGSVYNLAAISNVGGNVMAMMPHPERSTNGQPIFTSMRDYIQEQKQIDLTPLSYQPHSTQITDYQPEIDSNQLLVELVITDNEAATVANSLQQLDIQAQIKRYVHWEIDFEDSADRAEVMKQIVESGELFNSNKERLVQAETVINDSKALLIRYRDDFVGQSKQAILTNRLGITGIKSLKKGIIWQISAKDDTMESTLNSHILFNQFSQIAHVYR